MDTTTQKSDFDMADFTAWMAEANRQRAAENAKSRAVLHKALTCAGIDRVEAEYDAYGDSGNIESVALLRRIVGEASTGAIDEASEESESQHQPVQGAVPDALLTQIEDFLWTVVYCLHPGFENNDGGYGEIVWDLTRDAISVEHKERFTDVNCYSYEDL